MHFYYPDINFRNVIAYIEVSGQLELTYLHNGPILYMSFQNFILHPGLQWSNLTQFIVK